MASREEVYAAVLEILWQLAPAAAHRPLDEATNLVQSGLLDSFEFLAMIGKLEERFGTTIDIGQVDFETFTTIGGMCSAVQSQP